jgi:lipopolysaccharide export system protein LptA
MPRFLHIAASFVIVLVAYWTYALLAVPLIEPQAKRLDMQGPESGTIDRPNGPVKELVGLFAPDAWELRDPKVLISDRAILLIQKYETLDDGWVDLFPFTVVFLPDGDSSEDDNERARGAVVLQAPQGARLRFDQAFDLRRMKIGRLMEGNFRGPVTIRSEGKLPGPEDDLLATTRDVEMTEQHVWTSHTVDFRWGPHSGRGRDMHIYLLPRDGPSKNKANLNVGGVERFEVRSVDRLRLDLAGLPQRGDGVPGTKPKAPATQPAPSSPAGMSPQGSALAGGKKLPGAKAASPEPMPVEVTCRGPFQFSMVQQLATFREQVDVLRIRPTGPSDKLCCELLSIYFAKAAKPATLGGAAKSHGPAFELQPQRIEARGNPATLTAPADNASARAERLDYDFGGRIKLEDSHEVTLVDGPNEIHAPSVEYQMAPAGRLGRVTAKGPGWLRGQMADRADQPLEARWKTQLQVRPQDNNHVISLTGGAALNFRQFGQLDAQEVHFWLIESPTQPAGAPSRFQPDRMLAEGDVRMNSPQLTSGVERLEVWFDQKTQANGPGFRRQGAGTDGAAPNSKPGVGNPKPENLLRMVPESRSEISNSRPATEDARPESLNRAPQTLTPDPRILNPDTRTLDTPSQPAAPMQHFEVIGRLMRARVEMVQQKAELAELTVDGAARFAETQTAQPGERPMLVTGERLHVADANLPQTAITVTGAPDRPAHFEGRGMGLNGPNINLNRGGNRLWIDGGGQMQLPLDRDLQGQPLRTPGVLLVEWKRRMEFDGRKAQFKQSVTARGPTQEMQTGELDVLFQQPIRFSDPKPQQQPQVEQLLCRGGVRLDNREMADGQPVSQDRMQAADLAMNLLSGDLTAGGPGWLVSVRRGAPQGLGGGKLGVGSQNPPASLTGPRSSLPVSPTALPTTAPQPAAQNTLNCLHLRFLGSITGNIRRREMVFHEQVQAAYGPADSWQTILDIDNPTEQGGVLRSDHLQVNDMTPMGGGKQSLELLAMGNVVAEGRASQGKSYTARAIRMSYSQAKDLLVLEGDGRTDAELFLQQTTGGVPARSAAQKMLFWTQTHRVKIEGARSLEVNQFPGQPNGKFTLPGIPGVR